MSVYIHVQMEIYYTACFDNVTLSFYFEKYFFFTFVALACIKPHPIRPYSLD